MDIVDSMWRKSSYSGGNGGECIELASDGMVMVRDSKDVDGVLLSVSADAWMRFVATINS